MVQEVGGSIPLIRPKFMINPLLQGIFYSTRPATSQQGLIYR